MFSRYLFIKKDLTIKRLKIKKDLTIKALYNIFLY